MKKMYMTPTVEVNETMVSSMMALSLPVTEGKKDEDADVKEFEDWSIWNND